MKPDEAGLASGIVLGDLHRSCQTGTAREKSLPADVFC